MKLDIRYAHHPEDVKRYDTAALRRHFLVEQVFVTGELRLTYTHVDRVVFGGAVPTSEALALQGGKTFGTPNFLDRRELGIVNLGERGRVNVDGQVQSLENGEGMYVGMGTASVAFESDDPAQPAKFYLVSCPAHTTYRTVHITRQMANPRKLGLTESCNVRTINQYVHPAVCKSCQLALGVTVLEPGTSGAWRCISTSAWRRKHGSSTCTGSRRKRGISSLPMNRR